MTPPFPPKPRKHLGLFQHALRITQQSVRGLDIWLAKNIGGLQSSEEDMNEIIKPQYVDLWQYSFKEHVQIFISACKEYKDSFKYIDEPSVQLKDIKDDIRSALKGVENQAESNVKFLKAQVEKSKLNKNLATIKETAEKNRDYIKQSLEKADLHSKMKPVASALMELKSDQDVQNTVGKNIDTIRDIVHEGRKAALDMSKDDVNSIKDSVQTWLADKLLVAHEVVMGFIDGYREGKKVELESKDAFLLKFAKETAKEHAHVIKSHLETFIDKEKQKQKQNFGSK